VVQVHVPPPIGHLQELEQDLPACAVGYRTPGTRKLAALAWLASEVGGSGAVKKLFILALLVLGGFAVWRKVQAQRADLDLWNEATAADDF
jgi:hypothetical protein